MAAAAASTKSTRKVGDYQDTEHGRMRVVAVFDGGVQMVNDPTPEEQARFKQAKSDAAELVKLIETRYDKMTSEDATKLYKLLSNKDAHADIAFAISGKGMFEHMHVILDWCSKAMDSLVKAKEATEEQKTARAIIVAMSELKLT